MTDIRSIAELAYRQVFPNPSDDTKLQRGDFIATAKNLYATMFWIKNKQERRTEGSLEIPSFLLTEKEFDVDKDRIDITSIKALLSLDNDEWIRQVGTLDCRYIRTTISRTQLMKDDDAIGDAKTYYVLRDGKKNFIRFPKGVYGKSVLLIYANDGSQMDGSFIVDTSLSGDLLTRLVEHYGGKVGREDVSNNTNSEE